MYECRLQREGAKQEFTACSGSAWRGGDIRGKRLLIQSEQGSGDIVQFCRYIPELTTLGAEIIFEVPKALFALMQTLDAPITVVAKSNSPPPVDFYCPVMSLPYVFKTTLETIPDKTPYLFCDPVKVQQWQVRLGTKNRLRVGLAWSGSAEHKEDKSRSIPLALMTALTDLPVDFHSIQKEYRPYDAETLQQHLEIRQHQADLNDFSDTAALIACMDLIISVDTSVAHVAGATGKAVWLLLPHAPDYRWLLDRDDSPWYPTAKLYRQAQRGEWENVIGQVREELLKLTTIRS